MDVSKPNVARVYDCLLGGFEAFAADREQAGELLRISPSLGLAALENRYFLVRAITWAAGQGVTQFADLGAGAPIRKPSAGVMEDTHVTAQAANPSARVAYVDNDRVVLSRSMAFRAPGKGVAVIGADLTDTSSVLADPALRAVIDAEQPVCLIFGLVLSLLAARRAREVVAAYAERIAAGSLIVISSGRCDDETLWKQLSEAYTAADLHNHRPAEVAGFLSGLEVVPPGLTPAQNWRGGWHDAPAAPPGPAYVLGAVARKPLSPARGWVLHNLADQYRLWVFPVVVGQAKLTAEIRAGPQSAATRSPLSERRVRSSERRACCPGRTDPPVDRPPRLDRADFTELSL